MKLEVKRPEHVVPSYSLTGDLLSYLRCRLQYRYYNGSSLPPSRPVQQWTGEFLHGTLEMSYRFWLELKQRGQQPPDFPWPCTRREWGKEKPSWEDHDIGKFADTVEDSLRQQGRRARSADAREAAYRRIEVAVNELGSHLFPLIASTERKVIGTRPVPPSASNLRCDNYEVHGIIDVLSNVTLSEAGDGNLIRQCVEEVCANLQSEFEIIVDYKGARRPLIDEPYWQQGEWQIQTYAWLRERQPDSRSVPAGILVYINELTPGGEEMQALRRGLANGKTDVAPEVGSQDEQIIRLWRPGADAGQLSLDFRLRRAIRVIQISQTSVESALAAFDDVVRRSEEDVVSEALGLNILEAWAPNCADKGTCDACDFRYFCPCPAGEGSNYKITAPSAP